MNFNINRCLTLLTVVCGTEYKNLIITSELDNYLMKANIQQN